MVAGTRLSITLYTHGALFVVYWITTERKPNFLALQAPNNTTRSGDVKSCSLVDRHLAARHSPKRQSHKVELITFNRSTRKMRHSFIHLYFLLNHTVTSSHWKYRALDEGLKWQMERVWKEETVAGFGDVGILPQKKLMLGDLGGQDSNSGPP